MPGCFIKGCESVVNSEGARIKKCCASCKFKVGTNDDNHRKCKLNGKKVTKDFLCRDWCISDFFGRLRIPYNR